MKTKYFLGAVLALCFILNTAESEDIDTNNKVFSSATLKSDDCDEFDNDKLKCESPIVSEDNSSAVSKDELWFEENQMPNSNTIALFFQGEGARGAKILLLAKPISRRTMQKKVIPPKVVSRQPKNKIVPRPLIDTSYCDIPRRITDNQFALSGVILFETGTANLTKQAQAALKKIGEALQNEKLHGKKIMIEGHTDASGACEYNAALSKKRANAVKAFLMSEYKLTNSIEAIGEGEFSLLYPNDPTSAKNRRVRIATEKPANTAFSASLPLASNP